jgi:nitrite reductase/ring-hydroxylating ferredoxin subunit
MLRRGLLGLLATALGGAIAGGLGLLGGLFAKATSRWPARHASKWAALCRLDALADGAPLETGFSFWRVEGWYREQVKRLVYVTKDDAGAPVVFSRTCTHLGCPVRWKKESRTFHCPCHDGVFDPRGNVVSGPPKAPLTRLNARIAGEMVEVEEA